MPKRWKSLVALCPVLLLIGNDPQHQTITNVFNVLIKSCAQQSSPLTAITSMDAPQLKTPKRLGPLILIKVGHTIATYIVENSCSQTDSDEQQKQVGRMTFL
ncbi:hypothetical protein SynBIOSU31_00223 [Synechococcus sp. BIOS-U3-1]|uniref:hypothetical protein n=1 Tax=Synechococcus sp. BIOS-U3-1 TaxID=1400865 RepID=UPI00164595F3|nr:hypothetical protein [Synechococcus sp. BIOS-U3-1]QNI57135.1 hypothetical protein SynBIOSU31_00223 [Synechococcus sp. BIOS-U3-1]